MTSALDSGRFRSSIPNFWFRIYKLLTLAKTSFSFMINCWAYIFRTVRTCTTTLCSFSLVCCNKQRPWQLPSSVQSTYLYQLPYNFDCHYLSAWTIMGNHLEFEVIMAQAGQLFQRFLLAWVHIFPLSSSIFLIAMVRHSFVSYSWMMK